MLMTVLTLDIDAGAPGILNSNLLPVKAMGEVRFLSVVSRGNFGIVWTPTRSSSFSCELYGRFSSMASSTPVISSPRNTEIMAGGASLPPRR